MFRSGGALYVKRVTAIHPILRHDLLYDSILVSSTQGSKSAKNVAEFTATTTGLSRLRVFVAAVNAATFLAALLP